MKIFIAIAGLLSAFFMFGSVVQAEFEPLPVCRTQPDATVCEEAINKPQEIDGSNPIYGKGSFLAKATTLIALITGIASVIVIIIAGLKFITSQGDTAGVNSARNTIFYALLGLGLALLAQTIVIFVLNKL